MPANAKDFLVLEEQVRPFALPGVSELVCMLHDMALVHERLCTLSYAQIWELSFLVSLKQEYE